MSLVFWTQGGRVVRHYYTFADLIALRERFQEALLDGARRVREEPGGSVWVDWETFGTETRQWYAYTMDEAQATRLVHAILREEARWMEDR